MGDGSTTFNVPNLVGRYPKGGTAGAYGAQSLPNITGTFESYAAYSSIGSLSKGTGALYTSTGGHGEYVAHGNSGYYLGFDASKSSTVYANGSNVDPLNAAVCFCIRY